MFKQRLAEKQLTEQLFAQCASQLECSGYIARKGQIVDASIIPAPIQRNKRGENEHIKQGKVPGNWSENKRGQKDTDARWTKKHKKSYFGYKNHIQIDNDNKLIRNYRVTNASTHDSQVFDDLLDSSNTSKDVWADSAYRSQEKEGVLKEQGYRSRVQRKGTRNKPLSQREQQGNRTRSKVRSRVEHVFGSQCDLRQKAIRCVGMTRAQMNISLMNLTYNMRRLCFLQRGSAS